MKTKVAPRPRPEDRVFRPASSKNVPPVAAPTQFARAYCELLNDATQSHDWSDVELLAKALQQAWREGRQVFLCGNGGSAANAIHLANDLLYGVDQVQGRGLRVHALPANAAVMTCLANDVSYEEVFAKQLDVQAQPGDLLITFSGSGNSANIVRALERADELGLVTFAVLGFTGGKALALAHHPIYFPVHDMQVSEDLQMIVGHMCMQWLRANRF